MKDATPGSDHNPFAPEGFRVPSLTHKCCCVAVRIKDGTADVRDTKNPNSPTLSFTKDEWDVFVKGVKAGEFDIS